MFKPLKLPYHLHPYPLDFFEYLPQVSGEKISSLPEHFFIFLFEAEVAVSLCE
jgi:hypothetical protein